MPGEFPRLSQLRSGSLGGAAFGATARTFPFQRYFFGNKALHRVGHVGEPGAAAHLAVRKDVQPDGSLFFERGQNSLIFAAAQLIQWDLSRRMLRSGCKQLGRAQQTAHLFGAETCNHLGLT